MFEHDPRTFADECLTRAQTASSDRDKVLFLSMAHEWLEVAKQREIAALRKTTARIGRERQAH